MQTTLLGLAIAMILALVAALVAPLVVDWNHYRGAFESEVGRLTGLTVRVGTIDARILPSPTIKLRNVVIGEPGRGPQLRADALELEVRLAPLIRGQVQATEARLVAPQIALALDRSGALTLPGVSRSLPPIELSVSRLSVEDGSVILSDAVSGAHAVLRKLSFTGDVRSLVGPFRGEGSFAVNGEPFAYRISGAQADDGSGFRVRLGTDPQDQPLTTTVDGTLTFDGGVPRFAGTFALARPVGVTLSNGARVMSDPWHAGGTIEATPASATLQDLALQYGPDERAINFSGNADVTFGDHPHFSGSIKALEVDADRALAAPDMTRRPPLLVMKSFVEAFVQTARPPIPGDVALTIDGVTVGGTAIQSLHGKMRFDGNESWALDALDFRAPGLTDITLGGTLGQTPQGFAFAGPASLQSADAETLMAWLGGNSGSAQGQIGTLSMQGNLTIASDKLAVDQLAVKLDRESLDGRLAYAWPHDSRPAAVYADLHATRLNLDALSAFAVKVADAGGFTLPRAGSLNLDIGNAIFTGVDAAAVKTQMKFDAGALQIEQLSVGALAGAALDIRGRIDELSSQPRGRINVDLDARTLDGLAALADRFAPEAASLLRRGADRLSPAKIHAVVAVDKAATGSDAKLDLDGQVGLLRLALNADAQGERTQPAAAHLHVESRLDADDGTALAALFGIDRVLGVDQLPGRATLTVDGPVNGDLRVDAALAASGLDSAARGTLNVSGAEPAGALQMLATVADLRPLQQAMTGQQGDAVPVSARAAVAISGSDLSFTQIAAAVGKSTVRGRLNVGLASPAVIDGDVSADGADGAGVAALLLGLPRQAAASAASWSSAAVGAGAFAGINGAVTFTFDRANVAPSLSVSDLKGIAQFRPAQITLDNLSGNLAGGSVNGRLSFRRNADGLVSNGHLELTDADAATLLQADDKTIAGHLTLKLDGDSIGATPAAAVGSLHGSGTVALTDASLGGLDPAAFAAAMRTADQSNAVDAARIQAAVKTALGRGHLVVGQASAPVTVAGGKLGVANVTLHAQDNSALGVAGTLDLNTGTVDARLDLSADPPPHALIGKRPELAVLLKGPLVSPVSAVDVSALTGWLALRASEFQTRRLESVEANRRNDVIGPAVRPRFTDVRAAPRGTLAESGMLVGAPAPATGGQRLDLLQPELPFPLPTPAPPRTAGPDKRAAPLDLLRPQN